jgi:hypothetical protein
MQLVIFIIPLLMADIPAAFGGMILFYFLALFVKNVVFSLQTLSISMGPGSSKKKQAAGKAGSFS